MLPFFSQMEGKFSAGGGLPGALKTYEEDGNRRRTGHIEGLVGFPQEFAQFIVNDLYELLTRRDTRAHIFAHGLFFDLLEEIFGDFVIDIGLKKGNADFSQGVLDIGFGEFSVPS